MMSIAGTERMSEATYREVALRDENKKLELHRGTRGRSRDERRA